MLTNSKSKNIANSAKLAFDKYQSIPKEYKKVALEAFRKILNERRDEVLLANDLDLVEAKEQVAKGHASESMLKRLDLRSSPEKYDDMLKGIDDVIKLDDPVGKVQSIKRLDHELDLAKVTCPIGVLLIIFEARPEVIVNITALAIKSGNAAILKGGKESSNTQNVLTTLITESLAPILPAHLIQTVSSRSEIGELLKEDQFIDLVIPRGSKELVQNIKSDTKIPVLGHADGLCTIYVDEDANLSTAIRCIVDAKTTYPAACNSVETLLIHQSLLPDQFPNIALNLLNAKVTLKLDQTALDALKASNRITSHPLFWSNCSVAKEDDFKTEWLSLTLTVRTVESIERAIEHINQFSSHHTDSIITQSETRGSTFVRAVNSSSVYINCSTRFADGFRYGFGTEIGISTSKIHARGPVGLEGLVTYKWVIKSRASQGHITDEFGYGKKSYVHEEVEVDEESSRLAY
ncbi:hypothetical protein CROQUDRAFT_649724 [Cronartium quercuum f. sp. fusiforme G11]|uniref:glutamate-5-semialdehyde dehydrogenase n=1 Tax=Cronartium quercuum f. sp. fusiforme G11 TaxID=708437 RepID=A0A9P6NUT6_9BASI|nr:hypothetical protein CROQUDRAFT_649724 [Cronartium quercuum f. sp. fusiforme G11]